MFSPAPSKHQSSVFLVWICEIIAADDTASIRWKCVHVRSTKLIERYFGTNGRVLYGCIIRYILDRWWCRENIVIDAIV